jgi:hypothetical protein
MGTRSGWRPPTVLHGPFPPTVEVNTAQESVVYADTKETHAERNAREHQENKLLAWRSHVERIRSRLAVAISTDERASLRAMLRAAGVEP